MNPLEFWEKALEAFDRSDEKISKSIKIHDSFNSLLVYLKIRPCYWANSPILQEIILKEFSDIFKLKIVLAPTGTGKGKFVWSTIEPPSPKKKDLSSFKKFQTYIGRNLDYSCPGELQGDYPWQNRWGIHYHLHKESEPDKKFHIFAEICHKKDGFRARLREFSKVATLISTEKVKWKVTKTYNFTPLTPEPWLGQMDWCRQPRTNFYNRGKDNKISKKILDELFEILYYSIKNKYEKSLSKDLDISSEDVEKIISVFPNIYTFQEKDEGYLVESYHP